MGELTHCWFVYCYFAANLHHFLDICNRWHAFTGNQENTKHLDTICTMSAQRLRRWSNIVQMVYKGFVFAGKMVRLDSLTTYGFIGVKPHVVFWQQFDILFYDQSIYA